MLPASLSATAPARERVPVGRVPPGDAGRPARWLFAGLLLYFALQVVMRLLTSQSVELDEAEQLLWTQDLRLGYGPQPPLYSWLQWAFFEVFGASILALALLKNVLLLGTYSFTWLAARQLLAPRLAALSSASLLLLLQIVWESQRDLTHSVLVTTCAAATLAIVVGLIRAPRSGLYLLLGVAVGCGLLAKYSFFMFVVAFGVALLWVPATRRVLLDRRLTLTVLVAAALVAPHALWVLDHLREAASSTAGKLSGGQPRGLGQIARGLSSVVLIVPSFLSPLWLVLLGLFGWRLSAHRQGRDAVMVAVFVRYLAVLAVLMVLMVVLGGAAHFRDRWLQPLLFFSPLMYFVAWPGLERHARLPVLAGLAVSMALLCLTLISLRPFYNGHYGEPEQMNLPVQGLANAVRQSGVEPAVIVSNNKHLVGAMRLAFPAARLVHSGSQAELPAGAVLLLSYAADFDALRGLRPGWEPARPTGVAVPYSQAGADRPPLRFAYAFVNGPLSAAAVSGGAAGTSR